MEIQGLTVFVGVIALLGTLALGAIAVALGVEYRNQQAFLALHRRLLATLGAKGFEEVHELTVDFPRVFFVDYHRAVAHVLAAAGIAAPARGLHGLRMGAGLMTDNSDLANLLGGTVAGTLGAPNLKKHPVGPGVEEGYPEHALFLAPDGPHPLVLRLGPKPFEPGVAQLQAATAARPEAKAWLDELVAGIEARARDASIYRGHMLRCRFERIAARPDPGAIEFQAVPADEKVSLPAGLVAQLDAAFLDFKRHEAVLAEEGIPCQRGLLLCGPPGTGKTSTCRHLKRQLPGTTFLTIPMRELGSMEGAFQLARRLAPAVIVLDDVDLYAQSRDECPFPDLLGELMTQLDGLAPRERVDVILTSNSWKRIEKALALRPGRIDQVIMYENPDPAQRRRLLETFLGDRPVRADLDELVELSEGYAPARLRELVKRAAASAMARRGAGGRLPALEAGDFRRAAAGLAGDPLADKVRKPAGRGADRLVGLRPVAPEETPA